MKGQALAIAMVVAAGVAMYVMYLSNFDSLRGRSDAYYERQRFGDVFASLKRAPLRVAADIAAIPGVSAVETRVVASVTLDLARPRRAGDGPARLDPGRTGGRWSTICSCGAADGSSAGRAGRGARQRRLRRSPTSSSSAITCRRSSTDACAA